jgi:hypothetical protein
MYGVAAEEKILACLAKDKKKKKRKCDAVAGEEPWAPDALDTRVGGLPWSGW